MTSKKICSIIFFDVHKPDKKYFLLALCILPNDTLHLILFVTVGYNNIICHLYGTLMFSGRSYLVPIHLVPTHFVPTPLVILLSNYWFDPNKSDVFFELSVFFDKSMWKRCSYLQ